ncbi:MAG: bifunctional folylpolyglutamate synthase/dihydrofolate synthase [Actinobacteria bacterium]|nr:bifunctional folylpolyglutamate synthase/dihydrofolate synthase [Actinomycetota bacterium]
MRSDEALAWLDSHVNLESIGRPRGEDRRATAPTLDRIQALMELLGSPQLSYPAIHLTGTNGKTSIVRMTTAMLMGAGLSVGSYTSPNLERVNERMAWNDEPIDDAALAEVLGLVADVEDHLASGPAGGPASGPASAPEGRLSYFEILTGAALSWFADVAIEVAVVEVGLGGTWDATNVVDGKVAVITNVSIDHVEYLGPTREGIAKEKAGIIKPGATLVLGETDPDLASIFLDRGPAEVVTRDVDFGVDKSRLAHGGRLVDLYTPGARYDEVLVPLHGAHQAQNAAVALAAAEAFLGKPLARDVVDEAFAAVRSPGRLEVVGHAPLVLLDGAHNVVGASALRVALAEEFVDAPRIFVVGLLREKEPHEMLEALGAATADHIVCCRPPSPRALDPELVAAAARDLGVEPERIEIVDLVGQAVARALAVAEPEDQIVVTGSLYTVGAARAVLVH